MSNIQSRHSTKPCPFCAERIRKEAIKCRFCGEFLRGDRVHSTPEPDWEDPVEEEVYEEEERDEEEEYEEEEPEEEEEEEYEEEEEEIEEEELLYAGRPSIFALSGTIIIATALIAGFGYIYFQPIANYLLKIPKVELTQAQLLQIETIIDWIALGLASLIGLIAFYKAASLKSIYYEVTEDRIEWSRGIFDRRIDNLDMFRVVDLKLRRSLFDCIVGIGTVHLTTKDESDPNFDFYKVHDCHGLYNSVKKAALAADRKQNVVHLD